MVKKINISQEEINSILEKLAEGGYKNLNDEERKKLFSYKAPTFTKLEFILFIVLCIELLIVGTTRVCFAKTAQIRMGLNNMIKPGVTINIFLGALVSIVSAWALFYHLKRLLNRQIIFSPHKNKKSAYLIVSCYGFLLVAFIGGVVIALPFAITYLVLTKLNRCT